VWVFVNPETQIGNAVTTAIPGVVIKPDVLQAGHVADAKVKNNSKDVVHCKILVKSKQTTVAMETEIW